MMIYYISKHSSDLYVSSNKTIWTCMSWSIINTNVMENVCFVQRIIEKQNKVVITDRMWARLLSSTNQPSFLGPKCPSLTNAGNTDSGINGTENTWFSTTSCWQPTKKKYFVPHLNVWVMYYNIGLIRSTRNKWQGHRSIRMPQPEAVNNNLLKLFIYWTFGTQNTLYIYCFVVISWGPWSYIVKVFCVLLILFYAELAFALSV